MALTPVKRRSHGDDAIYFAADKNRYVGAISLGHGPDGRRLRKKVTGRTKQEVRDKLKALHLGWLRDWTGGRSGLGSCIWGCFGRCAR